MPEQGALFGDPEPVRCWRCQGTGEVYSVRGQAERCPECLPRPKTLGDARAERDVAVAQINESADAYWKVYVTELVLSLARSRGAFTTDDVWDLYDAQPDAPPVHDRRALGPIMMSLARKGTLVRRGYVPSRRRHATPIPEWAMSWQR